MTDACVAYSVHDLEGLLEAYHTRFNNDDVRPYAYVHMALRWEK